MIQQLPGTCKISILCLQLHVSLKDELPKRNEGNIPRRSKTHIKISSIRCSWERVFCSSVITIRVKICLVGTSSMTNRSHKIYFYILLHFSLRQFRIKDECPSIKHETKQRVRSHQHNRPAMSHIFISPMPSSIYNFLSSASYLACLSSLQYAINIICKTLYMLQVFI